MISFRVGRPGIVLINPKNILFLLWLFLLVFPKGGIKIAGVPITWGYLILGITFFYAIAQKSWEIKSPRMKAILCLLPFQTISALTIFINGTINISWTIALLTSFFFLPFFFFIVFSKYIEELNLEMLFNLIKKGITFVSYYGIALFIYKMIVGKYLEIPFLTVNWGDIGTLDDFKCNNRGIVSKLISTYNNGQLFGISMIILLPLYCFIQKNPWHRFFTKVALFLTLSRTTWIGLIFCELFYNLFIEPNRNKSFFRLFLSFLLIITGLLALYYAFGFNFSFFFDPNLGGRREQLEILDEVSLFSEKPFDQIPEIVPLAILDSFGVIGLLAYFLAMGGPIVINFTPKASRIRLCLLLGLAAHLFISFSDGAILYIPILAFYWFIVSLLERKSLEITNK